MRATAKVEKITPKQIKLLWTLAQQIGMDADLLHEMLREVVGKTSVKQLTKWEASTIIDFLVKDGGKVSKKRKPRRELPDNVVELVTGEQIRLIEYLVDQLDWEDPRQLVGFNKRVIKKERIGTKRDAFKIIEGLKAILERKKGKEVNERI